MFDRQKKKQCFNNRTDRITSDNVFNVLGISTDMCKTNNDNR